jgi:hypothetical protein
MKSEEKGLKRDSKLKKGLLERIAAQTDCMYLSDLRNSHLKKSCRLAVAGIPAEDYPVKVWQDAAYYITGKEENFKNSEDAKQQLLKCL